MDLGFQLQTTLGDAHTLERELRTGGMSRVFVAEVAHRRLEKPAPVEKTKR